MKKDLHPKYNNFSVKCTTCKKSFNVNSTSKDFKIDVCSNCHAFYVGKSNASSTAGRIDKFNQRYKKIKK